MTTKITQTEVNEVLEYFGDGAKMKSPEHGECVVPSNPIRIGDVLEKMKLNAGQTYDIEKEKEKILELVSKWGACEKKNTIISLSLSLQEIVEGGWETFCKNCACKSGSFNNKCFGQTADGYHRMYKVLKQPQADLIGFLFDLILTK